MQTLYTGTNILYNKAILKFTGIMKKDGQYNGGTIPRINRK